MHVIHSHYLRNGACIQECDCPNPGSEVPCYKTDDEHVHVTKQGIMVRCYHKCKSQVFSVGFWVGMTVGFPIEHAIWEKIPVLAYISSHWLGLH